MFDITGHVAVVTGSTSGIGLALARSLAEGGAHVTLNGLGDPAEIERVRAELAGETGTTVRYHPADMTKPAEIADLIDSTAAAHGRLDILVNNAGVQHVAPIDAFPLDKWDAIVAINLSAVFHAIRAAVPHMKRQGRGRIVNIASAHGLVASAFKGPYVATKHGVVGLTKSVGVELASTGVTCTAICPGYVKTPLIEGQIADQAKTRGMSEDRVLTDVILAAQPTKRFVEYEHLAGMLRYLVSDAGASATGAALSVDGGWTAQ